MDTDLTVRYMYHVALTLTLSHIVCESKPSWLLEIYALWIVTA